MFLSVFMIIIGFILLWKGGGFLIRSSENIAYFFSVPEFLIGLTLVAFGTSAPEFAVNIIASLQSKSDFILGNILGSNITNILLILGLSGLIFPIVITRVNIHKDIVFSIFSLLLFYSFININIIVPNSFYGLTKIGSFLMFCCFLFFLYKMAKAVKNNNKLNLPELGKSGLWLNIGLFLVGVILLPFGGHLVIKGAAELSKMMGVSEILTAIFILALGTSLPELATSIIAAYRQKTDLAIGNIIGSNIFNVLFVLGISGMIQRIPFNRVLNFEIIILFLASILLLVFVKVGAKKQIGKVKASIFLIAYLAYIAFVYFRG